MRYVRSRDVRSGEVGSRCNRSGGIGTRLMNGSVSVTVQREAAVGGTSGAAVAGALVVVVMVDEEKARRASGRQNLTSHKPQDRRLPTLTVLCGGGARMERRHEASRFDKIRYAGPVSYLRHCLLRGVGSGGGAASRNLSSLFERCTGGRGGSGGEVEAVAAAVAAEAAVADAAGEAAEVESCSASKVTSEGS